MVVGPKEEANVSRSHYILMKVKLINLSKRWGDVYGAKGIDLEIQDGEFVAFLGPLVVERRRRCSWWPEFTNPLKVRSSSMIG